jgi:hypothetical protein
MARSEREYLLELWSKNICPYCGEPIPEGKRVGSGKRADGGFCSLGHYAAYHELSLRKKLERLKKKEQ